MSPIPFTSIITGPAVLLSSTLSTPISFFSDSQTFVISTKDFIPSSSSRQLVLRDTLTSSSSPTGSSLPSASTGDRVPTTRDILAGVVGGLSILSIGLFIALVVVYCKRRQRNELQASWQTTADGQCIERMHRGSSSTFPESGSTQILITGTSPAQSPRLPVQLQLVPERTRGRLRSNSEPHSIHYSPLRREIPDLRQIPVSPGATTPVARNFEQASAAPYSVLPQHSTHVSPTNTSSSRPNHTTAPRGSTTQIQNQRVTTTTTSPQHLAQIPPAYSNFSRGSQISDSTGSEPTLHNQNGQTITTSYSVPLQHSSQTPPNTPSLNRPNQWPNTTGSAARPQSDRETAMASGNVGSRSRDHRLVSMTQQRLDAPEARHHPSSDSHYTPGLRRPQTAESDDPPPDYVSQPPSRTTSRVTRRA